jgi:hypothetical protein
MGRNYRRPCINCTTYSSAPLRELVRAATPLCKGALARVATLPWLARASAFARHASSSLPKELVAHRWGPPRGCRARRREEESCRADRRESSTPGRAVGRRTRPLSRLAAGRRPARAPPQGRCRPSARASSSAGPAPPQRPGEILHMADLCDRTAQNNSVLSPKPVHLAIKQ